MDSYSLRLTPESLEVSCLVWSRYRTSVLSHSLLLAHTIQDLLLPTKEKLCLISMSFLNQWPWILSEEIPEKDFIIRGWGGGWWRRREFACDFFLSVESIFRPLVLN